MWYDFINISKYLFLFVLAVSQRLLDVVRDARVAEVGHVDVEPARVPQPVRAAAARHQRHD